MTRDLHANQQPARIFQRIFYFSISREVIWATPKSTKQTCTVRSYSVVFAKKHQNAKNIYPARSTAGAAHGENERRSWAQHRASRAAHEPGVWCLWALPPGIECQDGCPVNFSKHFSALFSALFWSDRRASGVRAGCPRDGGLGWLCPNFLSTFFCTFFCTFLGGTPAGWRAGIKMGDQTQSASHLWTRTCQVLSSSDK